VLVGALPCVAAAAVAVTRGGALAFKRHADSCAVLCGEVTAAGARVTAQGFQRAADQVVRHIP
jgi:hypothetical protein